MSKYIEHAMREFRAAGWIDENGKYNDEMQEMICNHVLNLLNVFHGEGHSGFSANYTVNLFEKLARYNPISPLTGDDWEWEDVSEHNDGNPLWQNKRATNVFKDANGAYDIDGIIFYDVYCDEEGNERKSHYTCNESRVPVTFPYTPKSEYLPTSSRKMNSDGLIINVSGKWKRKR